jgi:hypothetical protein
MAIFPISILLVIFVGDSDSLTRSGSSEFIVSNMPQRKETLKIFTRIFDTVISCYVGLFSL